MKLKIVPKFLKLKIKQKDVPNEYESFDDIIFKGRNKDYGAYILRKNYHKHVLKGLAISLIIPLSLIVYELYLNYQFMFENAEEELFYYDPEMTANLDELAYLQLLEPPKEEEKLVQKEERIENLVPEIVDSVSKEIEEIDKEENKDTLGIDSDTTTLGNEGNPFGTEDGNMVMYYEVDSLPQFPGGNIAMIRYIVNNIKYPEQAIKSNITGIVYVSFCVKHDGSIVKVELQKGINPLLDAEAIRVVKSMPKWKPGKLKNKNVNVMFSLPINFNLRANT